MTAVDIIDTTVQAVLALYAVASFAGLLRYVFWTRDMAQLLDDAWGGPR